MCEVEEGRGGAEAREGTDVGGGRGGDGEQTMGEEGPGLGRRRQGEEDKLIIKSEETIGREPNNGGRRRKVTGHWEVRKL